MDNLSRLDKMLKGQAAALPFKSERVRAEAFAKAIAELENAVVVLSDIKCNSSCIYAGGFAERLGLKDYSWESSIWEKEILKLMSDEEREEKFLAELKFYHYVNRLPPARRQNYYLATMLSISDVKGRTIDVLHKMFYIYAADRTTVAYAVCIYQPLLYELSAKSEIVDSVNGVREALTASPKILTKRELQVLSMAGGGKTSSEIAQILSISLHTVSRHRQQIIAKLQVRNTPEALRRARALGIL